MKKFTFFLFIGLALVISNGCAKTGFFPRPLASINVVHAMPAGNAIVPVFGPLPPTYFKTRVQVYYGSSFLFTTQVDSNSLLVVPITDTVFKIFQGTVPLTSGGIYSFFLAGDTTKPDTLFVKDNIPVIKDSSSAMRFVNVAQGGKAISINLAGNDPTTASEVSNLGYLKVTDFKKYLTNATVPGSYDFEIRDQASGDLLTTFTWYYTVARSNTLVIAGSTDPSSGIGLTVFTVNNY